MPFTSKSQRAWMFANKPKMAEKWAQETPKGARLPQHKDPVKKALKIEKAIHKKMGFKNRGIIKNKRALR